MDRTKPKYSKNNELLQADTFRWLGNIDKSISIGEKALAAFSTTYGKSASILEHLAGVVHRRFALHNLGIYLLSRYALLGSAEDREAVDCGGCS